MTKCLIHLYGHILLSRLNQWVLGVKVSSLMDSFLWVGAGPSRLLKNYLIII